MNSCFRSAETGEFTDTDLAALKTLYGVRSDGRYRVGDWDGDGRDNIAVRRGSLILMDTNFDSFHDLPRHTAQAIPKTHSCQPLLSEFMRI